MTAGPMTATKDKNYDLICAVQASLHYVWQLEAYAQDADHQGDAELAEWFRKMRHNNQKAADQGIAMLEQRLRREGG